MHHVQRALSLRPHPASNSVGERDTPYDPEFFSARADGSLDSARVVAPIVMELLRPRSVVDVGCGIGTWLRAFEDLGVEYALGIDGDYVDRRQLLIDPNQFRPVDLTRPPSLGRRFDLAVCLEVGEHLPASSSPHLVQLLTDAAPAILFSAAVPGQVGTHHINTRWPHFWKTLFAERGYVRLDPIRPRIWRDRRVEWWYQQNIYLYASEHLIAGRPELQEELRLARDCPLELVQDSILGGCQRLRTLRGLLGELPRALAAAVRRRF